MSSIAALENSNARGLAEAIMALSPDVRDVRVFPPTQSGMIAQIGADGMVFAMIIARPTPTDPDATIEVWRPMTNEAWNVTPDRRGPALAFAQAALTPPPVDVAAAKATAIKLVSDFAEQMADRITGVVALSERLSWTSKEAAARAHVAGTATQVQASMLGAEASRTGETVDVLAAKIIANSEKYHVAAGLIAGQRRRTLAMIEPLSNPSTVEADIAAILTAAKAEAEALLAQLTA